MNLLPMGQGGCGTQAPTGREAQRRGEEYLELGHDSLSLAAFHLVLAAGRLILRLQSSRQALTAWPLCAGVNLYTRPLFPALFMGCRTTAQGGRPAGARRGGGSREPPTPHSASSGLFLPRQPTALGRAKIIAIQLEVFGSTAQAAGR